MIILSIDSSTPIAGVAIANNEQVLVEKFLNAKGTHSEKLMPMVISCFEEIGLTPKDIDAVVVTKGPGSFTGVRIGMATAKSIAQGAKKPIVAVGSLDGLAYNLFGYSGVICPVIYSKKNEVYAALYRMEGDKMVRHSDYLVLNPEELASQLKELGEDVWILGDGVNIYREIFTEQLSEQGKIAPIHLRLPRASAIAMAAQEKLESGEYDNLFTIEPLYLRKSEAELQWEKRNKSM